MHMQSLREINLFIQSQLVLAGYKYSKFQDLVTRKRNMMKLEALQKQHISDLRKALEELQADHYSRRQEEIAQLVCDSANGFYTLTGSILNSFRRGSLSCT